MYSKIALLDGPFPLWGPAILLMGIFDPAAAAPARRAIGGGVAKSRAAIDRSLMTLVIWGTPQRHTRATGTARVAASPVGSDVTGLLETLDMAQHNGQRIGCVRVSTT